MTSVTPLKSLDDYDDIEEELEQIASTPLQTVVNRSSTPPPSKAYIVMQYVLYDIVQMLLGGIYIGIGGMLYIVIRKYVHSHELGSLTFSIGLILVCMLRAQLYTGAIGKVIRERPIKVVSIVKLIPMLVLNVGGASVVGFFMRGISGNFFDEQYKYINEEYYWSGLKSIFCGSCVWHAVEHFSLKRPITWLKIPFYITMFVYAGFEHCIANSFYWSFYNEWSYKAVVNIAACIVGNSIGAMF